MGESLELFDTTHESEVLDSCWNHILIEITISTSITQMESGWVVYYIKIKVVLVPTGLS